MTHFFNNLFITCDAPRPWGVYFQDSASPQMEALVELHDNIMFYLVIILFGVAWIMVSIIRNYVYNKFLISSKYLNHGTLIELIWTITPALILILIAFPSFKLLYLMDEVTDPSLIVFVERDYPDFINNDFEGLEVDYPDFISDDNEELEFDPYLVPEFDPYLVPESDLEYEVLNMLEVDNGVILPEWTHVKLIISSGDVIHSYAFPALDIKCDEKTTFNMEGAGNSSNINPSSSGDSPAFDAGITENNLRSEIMDTDRLMGYNKRALQHAMDNNYSDDIRIYLKRLSTSINDRAFLYNRINHYYPEFRHLIQDRVPYASETLDLIAEANSRLR